MRNKEIVTAGFLFLLCMIQLESYSQERQVEVGGFLRIGMSNGVNLDRGSAVNQLVPTYQYTSGGAGIYGFVRFRKSDSSQSYFQYLKFDLSTVSSRTGAFDVNGNTVRIQSLSSDFSVLLPMSYQVSPFVKGYIGVGLNVGLTTRKFITPDQSSQDVNLKSSFNSGGIVEFGFKMGAGSIIAFRGSFDFSGNYKYRETAIVFGYCPPPRKRKG